MRKLLAIWLGKLLTIVGKIVGKKSSSSPGAYALKICPDLVKGLEKCVSKGIIVTCGTNGKTTTNNLMASALEAKGYKNNFKKLLQITKSGWQCLVRLFTSTRRRPSVR